jgi:hypothetical protein
MISPFTGMKKSCAHGNIWALTNLIVGRSKGVSRNVKRAMELAHEKSFVKATFRRVITNIWPEFDPKCEIDENLVEFHLLV